MIITFKSKASGDVIMFADVAERLMLIMDKDKTPQGIITVEQLPAAIAALRSAIAEDKARQAGLADDDLPQNEAAANGARRAYVSLAQRAAPLIELLEWAAKKANPVTWGV
jgi:hypothetical protein